MESADVRVCCHKTSERGFAQPRSQALSSLPPLIVGREAEKREPGDEVGVTLNIFNWTH